jgi:hypothetical protein
VRHPSRHRVRRFHFRQRIAGCARRGHSAVTPCTWGNIFKCMPAPGVRLSPFQKESTATGPSTRRPPSEPRGKPQTLYPSAQRRTVRCHGRIR